MITGFKNSQMWIQVAEINFIYHADAVVKLDYIVIGDYKWTNMEPISNHLVFVIIFCPRRKERIVDVTVSDFRLGKTETKIFRRRCKAQKEHIMRRKPVK